MTVQAYDRVIAEATRITYDGGDIIQVFLMGRRPGAGLVAGLKPGTKRSHSGVLNLGPYPHFP
jgi:hypothetical protein